MKDLVEIRSLSLKETQGLISAQIGSRLLEQDLKSFLSFAEASQVLWAGFYRGEFKAVWGMIPPVLFSDSAYLWLHVVEPIEDCEFVFVRNSQRAIELILRRWPTILGHCARSNYRARRWLRWLGATFERPQGSTIRFAIRAS